MGDDALGLMAFVVNCKQSGCIFNVLIANKFDVLGVVLVNKVDALRCGDYKQSSCSSVDDALRCDPTT